MGRNFRELFLAMIASQLLVLTTDIMLRTLRLLRPSCEAMGLP